MRYKISKPLSLKSVRSLSLSLSLYARALGGVDNHHRLLSRIQKIASCCYGKREDSSSRAARYSSIDIAMTLGLFAPNALVV